MHILENTTQEIEISEEFLRRKNNFHTSYIFGIFPVLPFFKKYTTFCKKKQDLLLIFSSLLSDIKKDFNDWRVDASDIEQVSGSLLFITLGIETLFECLDSIIPQNDFERNVREHEIHFFQKLLFAFNEDVRYWLQNHSQEINKEVYMLNSLTQTTSLLGAKEILLLQKKRLESQIENITKI